MFLAFDPLHQDGVDLRVAYRCPSASAISIVSVRNRKITYLSQVETFPDGAILFDYCNTFGCEGVVSKRLRSRYKPPLVQDQAPDWKRVNAEWHKLFQGPRKPE